MVLSFLTRLAFGLVSRLEVLDCSVSGLVSRLEMLDCPSSGLTGFSDPVAKLRISWAPRNPSECYRGNGNGQGRVIKTHENVLI